MNKKGFLLAEETLKIVIAVICIGFLVYLLTSLYLKNKESKELELAKASLEHLVKEINSMKEGEIRDVEIYNPSPTLKTRIFWGWKITSWSSTGEMPNQCSNLNWGDCICICKEDWWDSERGECDKKGACLESEQIITETINIDKIPLILEIKYREDKIILTQK